MSTARTAVRFDVRVPLDAQACHQALRARDARFDGRFFVGVTTTGIYCRPICPARTPQPARCRYFSNAALAEAHGFRPCLRCRPELAPGLARVDAPRVLARAAARLVDDQPSLTAARLAERVGVSQRHLRRMFRDEFGVSPIDYVQTRRLLAAKRLLTDTCLPMPEVARRAGFASVRRLHALFAQRYRLAPSALRRGGRGEAPGRAAPAVPAVGTFELAYRPPYDWAGMLGWLRRWAVPGIEQVAGLRYRRTLRMSGPHGDERVGWVEVAPAPQGHALRVTLDAQLAALVQPVLARLRHLLDVACDPARIAAALGPVAASRPGLRLPASVDGFETACRAVLAGQVGERAARGMAGRLVERFGTRVDTPFAAVTHAFPSAATVARLLPADLAALGIAAGIAEAVLALAAALAAGRVTLDAGADPFAAVAALQALAGLDESAAQYVAMRALAWPDAFPATDPRLLRALGTRSWHEAQIRAEAWRPWRAYAVMHLWELSR